MAWRGGKEVKGGRREGAYQDNTNMPCRPNNVANVLQERSAEFVRAGPRLIVAKTILQTPEASDIRDCRRNKT